MKVLGTNSKALDYILRDDGAPLANAERFDIFGFTCSTPAIDYLKLVLGDHRDHLGGLDLGEGRKYHLLHDLG